MGPTSGEGPDKGADVRGRSENAGDDERTWRKLGLYSTGEGPASRETSRPLGRMVNLGEEATVEENVPPSALMRDGTLYAFGPGDAALSSVGSASRAPRLYAGEAFKRLSRPSVDFREYSCGLTLD